VLILDAIHTFQKYGENISTLINFILALGNFINHGNA